MRRFLLILGLLLACAGPSWAQTIQLVQHVEATATEPTNCTNATPSVCTVTVSSTGSGHLLVVGFVYFTGNVSGTVRTLSSFGAGACSGSWQIPAGATGWSGGSGYYGVGGAYCLSSVSGQTSITFDISVPIVSSDDGFVDVVETDCAAACTWALDGTPANTYNSSASSSPTGQALTITGTTDYIFQEIAPGSTITGISGSYTSPTDVGSYGFAGWINTSSGSAPTWTAAGSATSRVSAMAFTATSSVSPLGSVLH